MDKLLLRFVALFHKLFEKQGIDFEKMLTIVQTKLLMDQRRTSLQLAGNRSQKQTNNRMQTVLIVYAFIGAFIGMIVVFIPSLLVSMIIFHAYVMFMMAMTLITDFSTVLLDTTDNQVLLPRPIDGKTLFMARLIHILIYIVQFTLALSAAPIACTFFKYGPVIGLVSIITVLLIVLIAVFLSYLFYLLIITFSSEKKVKDIITFMQILMVIFFSVGFQVIPRMIDFTELMDKVTLPVASYVLPPVWMAVIIEGIYTLQFHWLQAGILLLAVVFPIVSIWVMNKFLAPAFARKLAAINTESSGESNITVRNVSQRSISSFFSSFSCTSLVERGAFELVWKMTSRDKGFKLKFYPNLGYIVVYLFIFVFRKPAEFGVTMRSLAFTNSYLWFIYTPVLVASSSLLIIAFNENFQASWIYYSSPLHKPGEIILGGVKALFVKFVLPIFAIMLGVCLYVWGIAIIDDFIFGMLSNFLCCLVIALASEHNLPFSRQPATQEGVGNFLRLMLQTLVVAALVGIHYLVIRFSVQWALFILIPLVATICVLLAKKINAIPWSKIHVS